MAGSNIITLEGFCQTILAVMRKAYPDCRIEIHERVRNNGVHGKSLSIDNGFCSSSPEIPLDKFYRDYIGGQHLLAVCQAIAAYYECMLAPLLHANTAELKEMVVSMNREMDEEDVLSDNIYLYNRATDQIGIIGDDGKLVIE